MFVIVVKQYIHWGVVLGLDFIFGCLRWRRSVQPVNTACGRIILLPLVYIYLLYTVYTVYCRIMSGHDVPESSSGFDFFCHFTNVLRVKRLKRQMNKNISNS